MLVQIDLVSSRDPARQKMRLREIVWFAGECTSYQLLFSVMSKFALMSTEMFSIDIRTQFAYVTAHVCVCAHLCACTCVHACACVCVWVHMHIWVCLCAGVHVSRLCVCIWTCIYAYVCMDNMCMCTESKLMIFDRSVSVNS